MSVSRAPSTKPRIPITIITGFAGSGKTTLILNLLPQLRAENPGYKLALIKNEIGDLNVDSQLAAAAEMTGSRELLGDCICCANVGQIGSALEELERECKPDRIIIETSGSAEPLKLVVEVNRLAKETGRYELDGIISVVDAENWSGYANKSYTAKLQAQQTDLIIINKWEGLGERQFDIFLDRLGDLDVDTPQTKSAKGWINKDLLFGFDVKMARAWAEAAAPQTNGHSHHHSADHNSEMECLSVTLTSSEPTASVDTNRLEDLLKSATKDEVYRMKAVLLSNSTPPSYKDPSAQVSKQCRSKYILNWSFGRWTWALQPDESDYPPNQPVFRMSVFTAQYESTKWSKRLESGDFIRLEKGEGQLSVRRVQ